MMAQDSPAPLSIWRANVSGTIRARVENWDWVKAPAADGSYTYVAAALRLSIGQAFRSFEWQVDGSFPVLLGLPRKAVAAGPQGPLGYGGDYYAANQRQDIGAALLRQAYAGVRSGDGHFRLRLGRFEFADGSEAVPADAELAALKRDRINQRLIAVFGYALRSLDGGQLTLSRGPSNVTVMAARLVEGAFQLRAFREISADVAYGAFTRSFAVKKASSEVRLFALHYHDGRPVVKTDNRSELALAADRSPIRLITPGAHFISVVETGRGTVDLVLWGAAQFGRWGVQQHTASELAAEAGYRFSAKMQPWIRAGYFRSSGDSDPGDNRHNTFFQVLSTPRAYARFPSYILMNTEDRFAQFRFVPAKRWILRPELHFIRLSNRHDLWYDGGGAFQESTFGYLGRPGGGNRKVGTAVDISAEVAAYANTSVSFYGGVMRGGAAPAFVFPAGGRHPAVHLFSVEVIRKF